MAHIVQRSPSVIGAPRGHINTIILQSGSEAYDRGDSRNHGL